jgi:hypothetical protein
MIDINLSLKNAISASENYSKQSYLFELPPAQRSQCRYFNVERLTEWASKLLNSSPETLMELMPGHDILLVTNRIIDRLGWLAEYEIEVMRWNQMLGLTRRIETHLKQAGISRQSLSYFEKDRAVFPDLVVEEFQNCIVNYVTVQTGKFKDVGTFLATSDVIESLFGKYKQFSVRCPLPEMGQTILTLCLSTMNLTTALIKDALETISFVDVEDWLTEVFGRSTLSKRKVLFKG